MSQDVERNGSDLCLACGMCCSGVLHSEVMVLADEVKSYAPEFDVEQHGDQAQYYFEQPCRHLGGDNRCAIFTAGRPFACGVYACKLLKEYLAGKRELEDCLAIVAEARSQIADLHAGLLSERKKSAESPAPSHLQASDLPPILSNENAIGGTRFRVWDYVGEFLAGDFQLHEGAAVDLRTQDAENLHKIARLSFHLEKHFISPGERGVSGNNEQRG